MDRAEPSLLALWDESEAVDGYLQEVVIPDRAETMLRAFMADQRRPQRVRRDAHMSYGELSDSFE